MRGGKGGELAFCGGGERQGSHLNAEAGSRGRQRGQEAAAIAGQLCVIHLTRGLQACQLHAAQDILDVVPMPDELTHG